ncbi:MAG: transposase, partial [Mycobacteriaceae bacterium]|nr:transposase [Mycobacteriaceae bacterium]
MLQVSPSGFYASRGRPESTHAQTDRRLRVLVRASFDESRQRYGSPRIHEDLIEQAVHVSRKRVVRVMQEEGLQARVRKRFKSTTMSDHDQPVAANLLDRRFEADAAPDRTARALRGLLAAYNLDAGDVIRASDGVRKAPLGHDVAET